MYTYPGTLPPDLIARETYACLHEPISPTEPIEAAIAVRVPHLTSRSKMVVRRHRLRDFLPR